jgi:hypothetical protein
MVCSRPSFPLQLWQAEATEQLPFIPPAWPDLCRHARPLPLVNSLHWGSHRPVAVASSARPVTSKESMQPCCWLFAGDIVILCVGVGKHGNSLGKAGDPPIVASTMPLIHFGRLNRGLKFGFISELERVKTRMTTLDSTIFPRCRNNEASYAHSAASARPIAVQ